MRKTKIVVTLGPSTDSPEMIETLIRTGVNVFRLNFSHGDHPTHAANIQKIREASDRVGTEVAILQDISGPKVRIGHIDGALKLQRGDTLRLSKTEHAEDNHTLDLSYPAIIDMVNTGEEVFFADGTLQTRVTAKDSDTLTLELLNSGELTSRKGVNFPKTHLTISAITAKDENDLKFVKGLDACSRRAA